MFCAGVANFQMGMRARAFFLRGTQRRVSILFREGQRSVVERLSFIVRHCSRDCCRPFGPYVSDLQSLTILYHSEIIDLDVTSLRRHAKALRSPREEITNLTRLEVFQRRRILKSELLHRCENRLYDLRNTQVITARSCGRSDAYCFATAETRFNY